MTKQNQEDMKGAFTWILQLIHKQGVGIAILIWLALGQQDQIETLQSGINDCNQNTIEMLNEKNEELIKVVDRNSKAFENISFYLKDR